MLAAGLLAACGGGGGGGEGNLPTLDEQVGLQGDAIQERQARAENLIRDCMKDQGFDYVPVDPAAQQAALVGTRGLSEDEFHAQYGYGIATLYEQRRQQAAAGPNQAIRSSLSTPEKAAYDRALYGDDPTATFAVALDTGDFGRLGGCLKQATEKVFGGPDLIQSLTAKLDDLDARILADARMVDAVGSWSACMRRVGYDFGAQDEVDTMLRNKLEQIVGPLDAANTATPGTGVDYDREALKALQRDEVAMVKADIACEKKNITAVEEKVRPEYERKFREQNAALLKQVPSK